MRRSHPPFPAAIMLAVATAAALSAGVDASLAQSPGAQSQARAPVSDPVSAAVAEASRRFGVPESWIRSVMRVESAGNAAAVSRAGAMGLMQVMPGTYAELRSRYGLGPDPFAVRDNIMAGTAYLREMYDRYGAQGMLAAYNAGPGRWEDYARHGRALPGETIGYLAKLGPMLNIDVPSTVPVSAPVARSSPLQAPIFVTLHSMSSDEEQSVAPDRMRQIIAANTAVVPSSGELFVRRSSTSETQSQRPNSAAPTDVDRSPASTSSSPAVGPAPADQSLFPQPSSDPRR